MNKKIQIIRGLSIIAVIVIHTYNTYAMVRLAALAFSKRNL